MKDIKRYTIPSVGRSVGPAAGHAHNQYTRLAVTLLSSMSRTRQITVQRRNSLPRRWFFYRQSAYNVISPSQFRPSVRNTGGSVKNGANLHCRLPQRLYSFRIRKACSINLQSIIILVHVVGQYPTSRELCWNYFFTGRQHNLQCRCLGLKTRTDYRMDRTELRLIKTNKTTELCHLIAVYFSWDNFFRSLPAFSKGVFLSVCPFVFHTCRPATLPKRRKPRPRHLQCELHKRLFSRSVQLGSLPNNSKKSSALIVVNERG